MTSNSETGIKYEEAMKAQGRAYLRDKDKLINRTLTEIAISLEEMAEAHNSYPRPKPETVLVNRSERAIILRDDADLAIVIAAFVDGEIRLLNACHTGHLEMHRFIPQWSSLGVVFSQQDSYAITTVEQLAKKMFDILLNSEAFSIE